MDQETPSAGASCKVLAIFNTDWSSVTGVTGASSETYGIDGIPLGYLLLHSEVRAQRSHWRPRLPQRGPAP